jgi:hypothetical protein
MTMMMSQSVWNSKYISDPDFQPFTSDKPHPFCQGELSDLVRDLKLSKSQDEFLGSQLQGLNLLQNTNILIFISVKKILLSILLQLMIWFIGLVFCSKGGGGMFPQSIRLFPNCTATEPR